MHVGSWPDATFLMQGAKYAISMEQFLTSDNLLSGLEATPYSEQPEAASMMTLKIFVLLEKRSNRLFDPLSTSTKIFT